MNVINLIKEQIEKISKSEKSIFLDSILLHLERAEFYYTLGESDSSYYNDVIYRTNQAFEGALKEAFKILTNKKEYEVIKETPFQIEKYLEGKEVFKERVLELFKNYRNEWRNKSTHDFRLFFDSNEAFIAINNVSSFTYLLMKQIIEKIAFDIEQEKIKNSKKSIIENKKKGLRVAQGLYEIVSMLLSDTINFSELKNENLLESEIIGFLKANFSTYLNFAQINNNVKIDNNLRPDFIIEYDTERLILEIKKHTNKLDKNSMIQQLLAYLKYSGINEGIILALNVNKNFTSMNIEESNLNFDDKKYKIRIVYN